MNGIPMYTRVKRLSTLVYSSTASMLMAARALLSSQFVSPLISLLIYLIVTLCQCCQP
jgi:hypothetical protein